MNCFEHREKVAIGICKNCEKGLCEDCAQEVENGLACKDKCVERVNMINKMFDINKKVLTTANKQIDIGNFLFFGMGILFGLWALLLFNQKGLGNALFPGGFAIFWIILGVVRSRKKVKYPEV